MLETRKTSTTPPASLPVDYLKLISETFSHHFQPGLDFLKSRFKNPKLIAFGEISTHEVLLAISLCCDDQLSATTVYASCDFDPKASSPTVQDLLDVCVDAIASVMSDFLSVDQLEKANSTSSDHSPLEQIPTEWAEIDSQNRKVFVKMDRSNLTLDQASENWLEKHDPDFKSKQAEIMKKTEELFITGKNSKYPLKH